MFEPSCTAKLYVLFCRKTTMYVWEVDGSKIFSDFMPVHIVAWDYDTRMACILKMHIHD